MQLTAYLCPKNSAITVPPTEFPFEIRFDGSEFPLAATLSNSHTLIAGFCPHSPVAMYL